MPEYIQPTRRYFLITAGGLVVIAQSARGLFAAQSNTINGFNTLRAYGVKLYDETDAHNEAEHKRVRELGQNPDLK